MHMLYFIFLTDCIPKTIVTLEVYMFLFISQAFLFHVSRAYSIPVPHPYLNIHFMLLNSVEQSSVNKMT